jgi:hypothetical protein
MPRQRACSDCILAETDAGSAERGCVGRPDDRPRRCSGRGAIAAGSRGASARVCGLAGPALAGMLLLCAAAWARLASACLLWHAQLASSGIPVQGPARSARESQTRALGVGASTQQREGTRANVPIARAPPLPPRAPPSPRLAQRGPPETQASLPRAGPPPSLPLGLSARAPPPQPRRSARAAASPRHASRCRAARSRRALAARAREGAASASSPWCLPPEPGALHSRPRCPPAVPRRSIGRPRPPAAGARRPRAQLPIRSSSSLRCGAAPPNASQGPPPAPGQHGGASAAVRLHGDRR